VPRGIKHLQDRVCQTPCRDDALPQAAESTGEGGRRAVRNHRRVAMFFITASLMVCGDSAAGHRGTIPVPVMTAAALMLRLVACCSGVLPGVAVRLRNGPKSSNSSVIVTPEITSRYLLIERGVPPASSYLQCVIAASGAAFQQSGTTMQRMPVGPPIWSVIDQRAELHGGSLLT
jgi:hypothetical protein